MTQRTPRQRQRPRRHANPDGSMSLVEHIIELRQRLIKSLIALAVGTIVGYIWYQNSITIPAGNNPIAVPTLGDILRGPYCDLPPSERAALAADGQCKLLATGPFDMFMLRLKVGALAGVVFSSPVWLWQLWRFVTPGLYRKERRYTLIFVTLAVALFVTGAVTAYYIVSVGLDFLLSIGDQTQISALNGLDYYNFLLILLIIFGISFEVPLIVAMLNIVGVLSYDAVKDKRRIIIMVIFVFAAVATPGQDPFSMGVLGSALCILVELSFQFCRFNDKRRSKRRPEWMDTGDEAASPLDSIATPVAPPTTIDPAPRITPSTPGGHVAPAPESDHFGRPTGPAPSPGPGTDFRDVL